MSSSSVIDPVTGEVNMEKLQREMAQHMMEDDRYHRVDEMKKKAVLTSKNYDEFRQFVACAEDMLKPLKSHELAELRQGGSAGWEKSHKAVKYTGENRKKKSSSFGAEKSVPKTPLEFERDWRRVKDRSAYLKRNGPAVLAPLWKQELDASLLGQILALIVDFEQPLPWLQALCDSNRFSLNAAFIDDGDAKQKALALLDDSHLSAPPDSLHFSKEQIESIASILRDAFRS